MMIHLGIFHRRLYEIVRPTSCYPTVTVLVHLRQSAVLLQQLNVNRIPIAV
jgi:hypothetical protein